jgi:hypothetical protein
VDVSALVEAGHAVGGLAVLFHGGVVMGYFSNGSEGDYYRSKWCDRCANDGDERYEIGCAVWDVHLLYNGDQFENETVKNLLETLIPRDGAFNGQCRMFREKGGGGGGAKEPMPVPVTVVKAA